MADVIPDSVEKTSQNSVSVNRPQSGTYGEKAEINRLRQQLPQGGAPVGQPGGPAPMQAPPPGGMPNQAGGGRPATVPVPPGVPPALGHPTERPGVPLQTRRVPPGQSPIRQAESARDARIAALMALRDSPEVSDVTRRWAESVLEMLLRA